MSEIKNKYGEAAPEDEGYIKRFSSGDKSAFDSLVIKYKDKVFNLCYRFLGNHADADDAAQDVFVRVYRSLKGFKFGSAFSTWLYRITVNTCKNKLASRHFKFYKANLRIDDSRDPDGRGAFEIKDNTLSPETQAESSETARMIQEAINSLPDCHKDVVVLCDIEGLSYEEISKIMNIKIGTVKSKLSRAREILRDKLRELL